MRSSPNVERSRRCTGKAIWDGAPSCIKMTGVPCRACSSGIILFCNSAAYRWPVTETVLKPVFVTSSEKKWTSYEISSEASPDCHFRLLQRYLKQMHLEFLWSTRQLWVLTAPESVIRFICPKNNMKTVVLLFHPIEYQIRKILARVEVRRFKFLLMLQFVLILFQDYSH